MPSLGSEIQFDKTKIRVKSSIALIQQCRAILARCKACTEDVNLWAKLTIVTNRQQCQTKETKTCNFKTSIVLKGINELRDWGSRCHNLFELKNQGRRIRGKTN
jgi:hypothetical protein